ncbi:hypothetical protein CBM2595_A80013 [Cupriavidus taiwanensis]|nr:hypothetical protein CBM2595_A80013 [Cupriavidus taiwanensis]
MRYNRRTENPSGILNTYPQFRFVFLCILGGDSVSYGSWNQGRSRQTAASGNCPRGVHGLRREIADREITNALEPLEKHAVRRQFCDRLIACLPDVSRADDNHWHRDINAAHLDPVDHIYGTAGGLCTRRVVQEQVYGRVGSHYTGNFSELKCSSLRNDHARGGKNPCIGIPDGDGMRARG